VWKEKTPFLVHLGAFESKAAMRTLGRVPSEKGGKQYHPSKERSEKKGSKRKRCRPKLKVVAPTPEGLRGVWDPSLKRERKHNFMTERETQGRPKSRLAQSERGFLTEEDRR